MSSDSDAPDRVSVGEVFRQLAEGFPDAVHCVDSSGRIVYANRCAADLFGYDAEAMTRMTIEDLYAPEVQDCVRAGFSQLQDEGSLRVKESLICDRDGKRIVVEVRSFAVYDDQGRFLHSFTLIRDLTALKDRQNAALHVNRLAAIGELSSCIAHDISNPLSVIKLYAEWLATELGGDPGSVDPELFTTLSDGLDNIQKSAERIELLINNLRTFSRGAEQEPGQVDLKRVVERALLAMNTRLQADPVTVETRLPDGPCMVSGHADQLEQVVVNLITNACDAMLDDEAGTARLVIGIDTISDPADHLANMFEIAISDNGQGMTTEVQERVFEPFFSTKPADRGAGLGMTIVRNILRRHAGEIAITSDVGRGTTVSVRLPCAS